MKIVIKTQPPVVSVPPSDYRTLIVNKLNVMCGQAFFKEDRHSMYINFAPFSNQTWFRGLATLAIMCEQPTYIQLGLNGGNIVLKTGFTWAQVWEIIKYVDFKNITVSVE